MKVGFISLGCCKNLIDTEMTIGIFKKHRHKIVNNENEAEMIVINTCGFLDDAKEEAINTIIKMGELKKKNCKYLVVMGCLVQRYYDELIKELPEVDLFLKIENYDELWTQVESLIKNGSNKKSKKSKKEKEEVHNNIMPMFPQEHYLKRVLTTGKNYAYLKIGEGCSNFCTYCAIPYIRGQFVSRKIEDIVEEAEELAKQGIKELIIVAQDTGKYGIDLYNKRKLPELLRYISKVEGIEWIRVLYIYPEGITNELLDEFATNEKIVKYFDIPIQHISNDILKAMNRKITKENLERIINTIKIKMPEATIRTSIIVGFPGETEDDFERLETFIENVKFDKLGTFMYSKEDGTPAAKMPNQIRANVKKSRYNKIMKKQQKISKQKLEEKIGQVYEVLIEGIYNKEYYIGRTTCDAPDIDGVVYIKRVDTKKEEMLNKIKKCIIREAKTYDLIAECIEYTYNLK